MRHLYPILFLLLSSPAWAQDSYKGVKSMVTHEDGKFLELKEFDREGNTIFEVEVTRLMTIRRISATQFDGNGLYKTEVEVEFPECNVMLWVMDSMRTSIKEYTLDNPRPPKGPETMNWPPAYPPLSPEAQAAADAKTYQEFMSSEWVKSVLESPRHLTGIDSFYPDGGFKNALGFNENGDTVLIFSSIYDGQGRIAARRYDWDPGSGIIQEKLFTYDNNGNQTQQLRRRLQPDRTDTLSIETKAYDAQGRLIQQFINHPEYRVKESSYSYDISGKILRTDEIEYETGIYIDWRPATFPIAPGQIEETSYTLHEYNERGHQVKATKYVVVDGISEKKSESVTEYVYW